MLRSVLFGWTVRAGRFAQPRIPDLLPLDRHLDRHYGDQIEVEWPFTLGERPGRWRVLAFRNQVPMATYADALAAAGPDGVPADLARVRQGRQAKRGVGLNLEQSLTDSVDGRLNDRPEQVVEGYYRWRVLAGAWLSVDWQRLTNPGYNADRGPVDVLSLRWQFAY